MPTSSSASSKKSQGNKQQRTISSFFAPKGATATQQLQAAPNNPSAVTVDSQPPKSTEKERLNTKERAGDTISNPEGSGEKEAGEAINTSQKSVASRSSRRSGLRTSTSRKRDLSVDHEDGVEDTKK